MLLWWFQETKLWCWPSWFYQFYLNDDCDEFCDLIVGEDASDGDDSREDDAEVKVVIRGLLVG